MPRLNQRLFGDKELGRFEDLTGQTFGKLTVVEFVGREPSGAKGLWVPKWKCTCSCNSGKIRITRSGPLKNGRTRSCGCLNNAPHIEDRIDAMCRRVLDYYKGGAKIRNIQFLMTLEELKQVIFLPCVYCGEKASNFMEDRGGRKRNSKLTTNTVLRYNGMDRIKSELNYTLDNVAPCCKFCNWAKSDYSQEDFTNKIKEIYEHLNLGNK